MARSRCRAASGSTRTWISQGSLASGASSGTTSHTPLRTGSAGTTDFGGLSRLDLDGLAPARRSRCRFDWQIRAEALGWYDFAYRINGRADYNAAVLDVYEWQVDSGEVYVTRADLADSVDLTIGRKVVNWGRSDTFRVVDVVNPLDNTEPGLVDIEDHASAHERWSSSTSSGVRGAASSW